MTEKLPVVFKYDILCKALAEAVHVDEVKDIRDQAIAMAEYARRAGNREPEANAVTLRMHAERQLGEMMRAQKQTVGFATGGEHGGRRRIDGSRADPSIIRPTLAMQGIDKHLAHEARKLSALSPEQFKEKVAETHDAIISAASRVVKSITLPKGEAEASEAQIEITIPQWKAMSAAEREKYLDPANFPSDAKLNPQNDADGTDYAQLSYSTIVGCKHPCSIYCWAQDVTLRFPGSYPHGFKKPVFRPRMLSAPRNTPVPAEAAVDGRYKNVSSNFMSDGFGGWIPSEWIEATLAVERADARWNFLHLTKFPGRLLEFDIPPNCWMGTTVDWPERIPYVEEVFAQLREKYPDRVFWLSIEPMLAAMKFAQLKLFNWIAIGGATRSMRTPEWRPPHREIMDLLAQADAAGCKVFEKTNLYGSRILELPNAPTKYDYPQVAPDIFRYLKKGAG
jgi:hypothetical protein